jgi:hypothetical protein
MSTPTASNTTLEYFDGFDDYSTAQITRYWPTAIGSGNPYFTAVPDTSHMTIDPTGGRNGGAALKFGPSCQQGLLLPGLAGSVPIRTVGMAVKGSAYADTNGNQPFLIVFYDTATPQVGLVVNLDNTLSVYRLATNGGLGTLLLGPSAFSLSLGVYYYIEMMATIHATAGSAFVRMNGVTVLTGTSLNTRNTANNTCNAVSIGAVHINGSGSTIWVDDFYMRSDAVTCGDCRVISALPAANGFLNNFARGGADSGANWSQVNDNPANDDTNYIQTVNPGDIDLYAYPPLPVTSGTVYGVMACPVLRNDSAGTTTAVPEYRSGGANHDGTGPQPVGSTTYNAYPDIQGQDPGTGAAWTIAGVNGAQFGIKRVS